MASKYLNDCYLFNSQWAILTEIFNLADVALIEREFLAVIDFDLTICTEDILRFEAELCQKKSNAGDASEITKRTVAAMFWITGSERALLYRMCLALLCISICYW